MAKYSAQKDWNRVKKLDEASQLIVADYLKGKPFYQIAIEHNIVKANVKEICAPFKSLLAHCAWKRRKDTLLAELRAKVGSSIDGALNDAPK